MKNIAVILAGGRGSRFGKDIIKQLNKVAGKTILEHTMIAFQRCAVIDEIVVVIKEGFGDIVSEQVLNNELTKVKRILNGGDERHDSSLVAIRALGDEAGSDDYNLLFHDAVRPFISDEIIGKCVNALEEYNAVDVAIRAADTIIEVEDNIIKRIPDRSTLRRGQTPQAFKLKTIRDAYKIALADPNFKTTDDCGVVVKYLEDEPVFVVEGHESNIKITHVQDLFIADKLFQLRSLEADYVHPDEFYEKQFKGKTVAIFGGSYGIGQEIGKLATRFGAKVHSFSRSSTDTHIENYSDVEKAMKDIADNGGSIDYVVNTAAILRKEPLAHMDQESIESVVNINYLGAINVARASLPYLQETSGELLLFTSSSYTRGRANYSLYSSSKAAIVNLTQALAEEWLSKNVRINCICPERTKTPMRVKNFGNEPPETLLTAEEVAQTSVNTLSAEFTGQIITIKL